jgi:hypothetical protein
MHDNILKARFNNKTEEQRTWSEREIKEDIWKELRDWAILTLKAKIWSHKGKAVDEVDKILGCNDRLKVNLQSLQIPFPGSLKQKQIG